MYKKTPCNTDSILALSYMMFFSPFLSKSKFQILLYLAAGRAVHCGSSYDCFTFRTKLLGHMKVNC